MKNTRVFYLYRDNSNYKIHLTEVLVGTVPTDELDEFNKNHSETCFYPETLGMTATTFVDEGYASYDDDPDFHEFGYLEQTDDEPTVSTTVGKFMPVLEKEGQM